MKININHESDGFVLYIDGEYYGNYDSPVQAAQAVEDMDRDGQDDQQK